MARTTVEMDIEFPDGVTLREYERIAEGHAFHVEWTLPEQVCCERCERESAARFTCRNKFDVVRDLDIWGQPSFFVYQPPQHQCRYCGRRQQAAAPFKRRDVKYTYRFEEYVVRSLIGSTEEEVAERLGIAAETVALIVKNQLADDGTGTVDSTRTITDVGLDEISLKKRHKLYAMILTDLTDPNRPQVLAVAQGKDEAAARTCLTALSPEQRAQVKTHRTDMSAAILAACRTELPNSQSVIDRFHVAKAVGEWADRERKKNHAGLCADAEREGTPGVQNADVGVSSAFARFADGRRPTETGGFVRDVAGVGIGVSLPRGTGRDL
jgi:transposase